MTERDPEDRQEAHDGQSDGGNNRDEADADRGSGEGDGQGAGDHNAAGGDGGQVVGGGEGTPAHRGYNPGESPHGEGRSEDAQARTPA